MGANRAADVKGRGGSGQTGGGVAALSGCWGEARPFLGTLESVRGELVEPRFLRG